MTKHMLHAPNIHAGGGLRLLQALLRVRPVRFAFAHLDARVRGTLPIPDETTTCFVPKSLVGRLKAEWRLREVCTAGNTVLCFSNLPPLFRIQGRAIVFVQNRLLVETSRLTDYPPAVRARVTIERLWLRWRQQNAERYIVQSISMELLLRKIIGPNRPIAVTPFLDQVVEGEAPGQAINGRAETRTFDFIYAASGDPHKNHEVLIEAWRILGRAGLFPKLCLTIDANRFPGVASAIDRAIREDRVNILNIGWIPSSALISVYAQSGALIYPSLVESFGLPLLEAAQVNMPVLASERDYVRDVVDPVQTFDPRSPLSIARAVRRHLNVPETRVDVSDAERFLSDLLS